MESNRARIERLAEEDLRAHLMSLSKEDLVNMLRNNQELVETLKKNGNRK